jgi:hypothetical protein
MERQKFPARNDSPNSASTQVNLLDIDPRVASEYLDTIARLVDLIGQ